MARTYESVYRATEENTTSTSLTDTNVASHLTASFSTGTWYVIFSFDLAAENNGATTRAQTVVDGTSYGDLIGHNPHQDDTTDYRYRSFIQLATFEGDGTSKTMKMQFLTTAALDTAHIRNISIIALKEETGDVWHEDLTDRSQNGAAWAEYATFTPASGTYYMISSALMANSVAASGTSSRITLGGTVISEMDPQYNSNDEFEPFVSVARIAPNGSQTIDLDYNDILDIALCNGWQCLLLNADTFEDADYNNDTTQTQTTSTSYTEHDSITINGGGGTNKWLLLNSYLSEVNASGSGGGVYVQVTIDGTVIHEQTAMVNGASNLATSGGGAHVYTGDGASATMDMDVKGKSAAFNRIEGTEGGSWLIALLLDAGSTLEQNSFRWYDDDADPTTATALEAQDTDEGSRASETTTILRQQIQAVDDPDSTTFKLQWRVVGDPASEWEDVPLL